MMDAISGTGPIDRFSVLIKDQNINEIELENDMSHKLVASIFHRSYQAVEETLQGMKMALMKK